MYMLCIAGYVQYMEMGAKAEESMEMGSKAELVISATESCSQIDNCEDRIEGGVGDLDDGATGVGEGNLYTCTSSQCVCCGSCRGLTCCRRASKIK